MKVALDLIKKGNSQHVEEKCAIPRRTLANLIKTQSVRKNLGRKTILTKEQETDLENKIIRLADKRFPTHSKIIKRSVFKYVEQKNNKHCFNKEKQLAGREWLRTFIKNHLKLSRPRSQIINPARVQKLNCHIVDHLKKLGEFWQRPELKKKQKKFTTWMRTVAV